MKKKLFALFTALLFVTGLLGQSVELMRETFGNGGFWEGPMNTNPNLTSSAIFSADKARTQNWNASKTYDKASGGFHVILTDAAATDTVKFSLNTNGFSNLKFSMGAFSWGAAFGQFAFEYSSDGISWTPFNKGAITTGDLYAGGWQYLTFSETLPEADDLSIKVYRTAAQVHLDDLILTGEPTIGNALLKSVGLDVGTIKFKYYTNDYVVMVPYGTTQTPVITAATFDPQATVNIANATDINSSLEADRTSTITVTAEDGTTTKVYTLLFNVTPPRTDAALNSINLSYATLAPSFSKDQLRYLVDLPDTATVAPSITPILSDASGASFLLTEPSNILAEAAAERTATIVVTAQDGVTTRTYQVVFKVGGGSTDLFLIDYETFGSVGNRYGIVLNTYPGFTSSWVWGDQMVSIRTSSASAGYDLASGGNRIEVQAGWATTGYDTIVFMANTTGFKNVALASGVRNNSGHVSGAALAFRALYSEDSINWTSIGNETQLGTAFPPQNSWSYVVLDDVLPADESLYIMFSNINPNFEYWLDDISLWGTPLNTNNQLAGISLSEGSLSPAFSPTVTAYMVDLPQGTSVTPTVTPSVLSPSAVIEQTDATDIRSLTESERTTTIKVTAENGSVRTYTIIFNVFKSSEDRLKELSAGGYSMSPLFSNDVFGYAVKLPAGTTEAPAITAVAEDDYATVTITGPANINSSDVADRTAIVEVVAEDDVNSRTFTIVFTFGSLTDVRFNFLQEKFSTTGNFQADAYPGYTSDAIFDGDEHRWDNPDSDSYPLASGGAAMKFGEWAGVPTYVELVMQKKIEGYNNIMLSFGIEHNSGGWGTEGCGLTNNFIKIEYTLDSITWVTLNKDSLVEGSSPWPCGGKPFNYIELAEIIPVNEEAEVTLRFTHTDGKIHPFYLDDIVLSGSPISTDASLNDLSTASGSLSPLFDPAVHEYTVELPIGTTQAPEISAVAAEEGSGIDIVNASNVASDAVADRTATITVIAPDGVSQMVYSIVFSVLPNNDATLNALTVSNGTLYPSFSVISFDYSVELPAGTTATPTVTATPNDAKATLNITNATNVASQNAGDRTTTILVTAEDGVTTLTYSIVFTRSTVGVDKNDAPEFSVYPNPATNQLYITHGDQIESLSLTNVAGEVIMKVNAKSSMVQLDISGIDAGYYFVRIKTVEGAMAVRSFVKK